MGAESRSLALSRDITICSNDVAAVVFPCSQFEVGVLIESLTTLYGFKPEELQEPTCGTQFLVDWVQHLGECQPIHISLRCWRVCGVWICFAGPAGDIFSYRMAEDWLRGHFSCKRSDGQARAFSDPSNFHNCVAAVLEAVRKRSLQSLDELVTG